MLPIWSWATACHSLQGAAVSQPRSSKATFCGHSSLKWGGPGWGLVESYAVRVWDRNAGGSSPKRGGVTVVVEAEVRCRLGKPERQ